MWLIERDGFRVRPTVFHADNQSAVFVIYVPKSMIVIVEPEGGEHALLEYFRFLVRLHSRGLPLIGAGAKGHISGGMD